MVNCVVFGVFAILAVAHGAVLSGDEYAEGVLVPTPAAARSSRLAPTPIDCTAGDLVGPYCDTDCKTLVTCLDDKELKRVVCTGTTPYCQSGKKACTATSDTCTEISEENFICTSKGYFPNVMDCTKYYQCATKGGPVQTYKCPTGYNYYPETKGCKLAALCVKINCTAVSNWNKYLLYTPDPSVYVYCPTDADNVPLTRVYRCAINGFSWVLKDGVCAFTCLKEGRVADAVDNTKFYDCFKSGTIFNYVHSTCVTGNVYSAVHGYCIDGPLTTIVPVDPVDPVDV